MSTCGYKERARTVIDPEFGVKLFDYSDCEFFPFVDPEFMDQEGNILTEDQKYDIAKEEERLVKLDIIKRQEAKKIVQRERRARTKEREMRRAVRHEMVIETMEIHDRHHAKRSRTIATAREEARLVREFQAREVVAKRHRQHQRRIISSQSFEDIDLFDDIIEQEELLSREDGFVGRVLNNIRQDTNKFRDKVSQKSIRAVKRLSSMGKSFVSNLSSLCDNVKKWMRNLLISVGKHLYFDKIVSLVDKFVNTFGYVYTLLHCDDMVTIMFYTKLYIESLGLNKISEYAIAVATGLCHKLARSILASPHRDSDRDSMSRIFSAQSLSEDIENFAGDLTSTLNLPTIKAIINLLLVVAKKEWLPKHVAFSLYDMFGTPSKMNGLELMQFSLQCVAKVVKAGELIYEGATISQVLFAEDPVQALSKEIQYLISMRERTYTGLHVEDHISMTEYDQRIRVAIANAMNFKTKISSSSSEYKTIESQLLILTQIKLDNISKTKGKARIAPKGYVIHGASSIGKSHIIKLLCKLFCDVMKIPYSPSLMYQKNAEEFWTGYEPFSQPFIQYPEVGCMHRNIAARGNDVLTQQLLSLCDSNPFNCPMADVASKGNTYAFPLGVFIDTNIPGMNLDVMFNNPAAFERRFDYIRVVVDADHRKPGSMSIDPNIDLGRRFLDKYTFYVYGRVPLDEECKTSKPVVLFMGRIDAFCDYIRQAFEAHLVRENKHNNVDGLYGYGDYEEVPKPVGDVNLKVPEVRKNIKDRFSEAIESVPSKIADIKRACRDGIDFASIRLAGLYGSMMIDPIENPKIDISPISFDPSAYDWDDDSDEDEKCESKLSYREVAKSKCRVHPHEFDCSSKHLTCTDCGFRNLRHVVEKNRVCSSCKHYYCLDCANFSDDVLGPNKCIMCDTHKNPEWLAAIKERDYWRTSMVAELRLNKIIDSQCSDCKWYPSNAREKYVCAPGVPLGDRYWITGHDGMKHPDPKKFIKSVNGTYARFYPSSAELQSVVLPENEIRIKTMNDRLKACSDKSDASKLTSANVDLTMSNVEVAVAKFMMRYEPKTWYHFMIVVLLILGLYIGFTRVVLALCIVHCVYLNYSAHLVNSIKNKVTSSLDKQHRNIQRVKRLLGDYESWISPSLAILSILSAVAACMSVYCGSSTDKPAVTVKRSEKHFDDLFDEVKHNVDRRVDAQVTEFKVEDPYNVKLNEIEVSTGASKPAERIVIKTMPSCWNVKSAITRCIFTQSIQELDNVVRGNVVSLRYVSGDSRRRTKGILLCNNVLMFAGHSVVFDDQGKFEIHVSPTGDFENDKAVKRTILHKDNLVRVNADAFIAHVSQESVRDITKFFAPDDVFMKTTNGLFSGELVTIVHALKGEYDFDVNSHNPDTDRYPTVEVDGVKLNRIPLDDIFLYRTEKALPGMCITPLLMEKDKGGCISGVHILGTKGFGGAIPITKSMIDKAIIALRSTKDLMILSGQDYTDTLPELDGKLHPKSLLNYIPVHGAEYLGSLEGVQVSGDKSQVTRTNLKQEDVDMLLFDNFDFVGDVEFGPPLLSVVTKPTYINPININVENMVQEKTPVDRKIVLECVEVYDEHISGFFPSRVITPWDIDVAINGFIKDGYIKRLDLSKSAGFANKGKKRDHVIQFETPTGPYNELESEFKKKCYVYLNKLRQGIAPGAVFQTKLKDEPRDVQKTAVGKTRLFCISEMIYLICARMYLGPIYTLIMESNEAFRTALGVDMHRGGVAIFQEMRKFSHFIKEGDYSKYDQLMPFEIGWGVATLVYRLAKRFGYNDEALECVRALMTDSLFPILVVNADVFRVPGFQPSGFYDTISNNSMRGVLLKLYFFAVRTGDPANYFKHTCGRVAGDDTADAVSEEMKDVYNGVEYQKFVSEHFGMKFTPTDKDGSMTAFVEPDEVSFLKRKMRHHLLLKRDVCVLDMNSIRKTLLWRIPSGIIDNYNQTIQACQGTLTELFLHCRSSEQFNKVRDNLIDIISIGEKKHRDIVASSFKTCAEITDELNDVKNESVGKGIIKNLFPHDRVLDSQAHVENLWPNCTFVNAQDRPFEGGRKGNGIKLFSFTTIAMMCVIMLVIPLECCGNARTINKIVHQNQTNGVCSTLVGGMKDYLIEQSVSLAPNTRDNVSVIVRMRDQLLDKLDRLEEVKSPLEGLLPGMLYKHTLYGSDPFFKDCVDRYVSNVGERDSIIDTIKLLDMYIVLHSTKVLSSQAEWEANTGSVTTMEQIASNMMDVSGDQPDVKSAGDTEDIPVVPKVVWTNEEFFKRPIYLTTTTWNVGSELNFSINPWTLYLINPAVRAKFRNQWLMRHANLHLRVVVSGTPFHQGRIMHSYYPLPYGNQWLDRYNAIPTVATFSRLVAFSQLPGTKYIDPSDNQPSDLVVPLIKAQPAMTLGGGTSSIVASSDPLIDFLAQGVMNLNSFGVLEAVTDAPTNVSINVYAWMTEVDVGINTGTRLVVDAHSSEEKVGPIQRTCATIASVARKLSDVPIIGQYARAGDMIFGGLGKLAAINGYSRPNMETNPVRMKNEPFQNAAHTIGGETGHKITLDPLSELSVGNTVTDDQEDQMHLNYISNRESFIARVDWTTTSPVMVPFYAVGVTPCHLPTELSGDPVYPVTNYQPTPAGWVTTFFSHWRADRSVYRFDVFKTKFHRGKWGIMYEPNADQSLLISGSVVDLNLEHVLVIDLQEVTSFEIELCWNQKNYYRQTLYDNVTDAGNTIGSSPDFSTQARALNGYFVMFPITQLQAPLAKSIHINIFSRFPDLDVNGLVSWDGLNESPYESMAWNGPTVVDAQAADEKQMVFDINGSSSMPPNMLLDVFAENPKNFRSLLKRWYFAQRMSATTNYSNPTFNVSMKLTANVIPDTPIDLATNPVTGAYYQLNSDLFQRVRMAYLGMRGSHKWRVSTGVNFKDIAQARPVIVSLKQPTSTPAGPSFTWEDAQTYPPVNSITGFTMFVPQTQSGIEFQLPMYSNNRFCFAQTMDPYYGSSSNNFFDPLVFRQFLLDWPQEAYPTNYYVGFDMFHAIGDDFSFMHFMAAPPFSAYTPTDFESKITAEAVEYPIVKESIGDAKVEASSSLNKEHGGETRSHIIDAFKKRLIG